MKTDVADTHLTSAEVLTTVALTCLALFAFGVVGILFGLAMESAGLTYMGISVAGLSLFGALASAGRMGRGFSLGDTDDDMPVLLDNETWSSQGLISYSGHH